MTAMISTFRNDCGRPTLEVEYDPRELSSSAAAMAATLAHGFYFGQVPIVLLPRPYPST